MRLQNEASGKIKEKAADSRKKNRKLQVMEKSNKRQTTLLDQRNKQNESLKKEAADLRAKLQERNRVWQ